MNYAKLEEWRKVEGELKRLKEQEAALRKSLVKELFQTEEEGAHTLELEGGWSLSMTQPYNRSLDQDKVAEALKALKKAKADPDLIKVKYELSVAAYRDITPAAKTIIDSIMTTKPGMPSLKLIPPKGTP